MLSRRLRMVLAASCAVALSAPAAIAQVVAIPTPEAQTVASATQVLQQFTTFRIQSIPHELLRDAQGVVIVPNVIKIGFLIAGRFGRGVALVRAADGNWRVPAFVTFMGGSVGWQAGVQSTDIVLVFKNRRGIETLLTGNKFTLGADAAIAAGPVGRQAATGTDLQLNAEIYSYSRSRGLFAGVSLDGSILQIDNRANMTYYAGGTVPAQAIQLASLLAGDAAAASAPQIAPAAYTAPAGQLRNSGVPGGQESTRRSLIDASQRLSAAVDPTWRGYLALPAGLQAAADTATQQEKASTLARYNAVLNDPKYRSIAQMPQFQSTLALLKQYTATDVAEAMRR